MLFNSSVFVEFFAAVLLLYWLVRNNLRRRNILLVVASYYFYGWWDYRFLGLLIFSTVLDYAVGVGLDRVSHPGRRKLLLMASVVGNLGILGFFKYYNFFIGSLTQLLTQLNIPFRTWTLEIVLPMGISFYTFQTMSYIIDVYRGEFKATRSLLNFAAYISFFPQLVAGPIERAKHLLPQFERTLTVTLPMVEEGLWLCLWGMFKKVVLADNLAPLVEMVYDNPDVHGPMVVLATVAFGFQIYCDFSGYSDIARGSARILGFDIMVNFDMPYGATSVREFWRRWHISLSTWLRDYLYISLGGNRRGQGRTYFNLLLTMFLGGLWHGAAWNFVLWGLWHGVGLAAHRLFTGHAHEQPVQTRRGFGSSFGWGATMIFVFYGWLLFRAGSLRQVSELTLALSDWSAPFYLRSYLLNLVAFTAPVILMEVWQAKAGHRLAPIFLPFWGKAALQGAVLLAILLYWERQQAPFLYFQF